MLLDMFPQYDRLGRDLFSMASAAVGAPVEIRREDDRYVIDADLPGVDPASIDVTVEGEMLTIRAERSKSRTTEDAQWVVQERSASSFVRRFHLGDGADLDGIQADYRNGVLTVVVPITESARAHKVPVAISSGGKHKALTGAATEGTDEGKAQAAHSLAS